MAQNWLLNPAGCSDAYVPAGPSRFWLNASGKWEWTSGTTGGGNYQQVSIINPAAVVTGDTIDGMFTYSGPGGGSDQQFQVSVPPGTPGSIGGLLPCTQQPGVGRPTIPNDGQPHRLTWQLPAGLAFYSFNPYVINSTSVIDAVPVAPPPVVVAGNVSATVGYVSPSVPATMTPAVTANGVPVVAATLIIDTPPANGNVVVSGANLVYTPNAGFVGTDTFKYHATYSGATSNEAIGTVTVNPPVLGKPIQRLHRLLANLYADTEIDCYVRTDNGAMDLTGYQLTAHIHPYQRPQPWGIDYGPGMAGYYVPWETSITAQQIAVGHVQFLVDHGTVRARLGGGLWRVHLVAVHPTTQQRTRVYTAQLIIQ